MAVELYINDTLQTNYILSTPFKDTIDEELDTFNFQIKGSLTGIKKNDKVRYIIKKGDTEILNKVFCVFEKREMLTGEQWLTQITCLSPTKLLENIIVNGMAMTEELTNLGYQIVKVKDKIKAQLGYEERGIDLILDSSLNGTSNDSLVKDYACSDFLWSGQTNVKEIFNDMLDKADCLIIGYDYTLTDNKITNIYLKAIKRELQGSLICQWHQIALRGYADMIKGQEYNFDSELKVGSLEAIVKNAITNREVETGWQGLRNTDSTIDNASQWQIITTEPIYSLKSVKLKMIAYTNNTFAWFDQLGDFQNHSINFNNLVVVFDITNYIVEKKVFDNLSLDQQKKSLYFIRGQKNIYGLVDRYKIGNTGLFSNTAIHMILNDILSHQYLIDDYVSITPLEHMKYGSDTIEQLEPLSDYLSQFPEYQDHHGNVYLDESKVSVNYQSIERDYAKYGLYNTVYVPYCDSVVKLSKSSDLDAKSENLSTIKNQSDRTIDATKYYNSQQSIVNRMGNDEWLLDCIVDLTKQNDTIWNLGDYFLYGSSQKKWTIIQRTISYYGDEKLKVLYKLSKTFNASNVDIQVNRDKRLYGIPLNDYVDRYIIIKKSGLSVNDTDKIGVMCWDDFTGNSVITGYCINSVIPIGNSNVLDKVITTQDNFAVDTIRSYKSSTYVNVPIRYCDADGLRTNITLRRYTSDEWRGLRYQIAELFKLPFLPQTMAESTGTEIYLPLIYKDKMERLIFIFK